MDILVTFDENYISPFETMAKSLIVNHPKEQVTFWLLHKEIPADKLTELNNFCQEQDARLNAIQVDDHYFEQAKVTERYPVSMYYRLLAPIVLPDSLSKILYLDPDILVINHLGDLWNLKLKEGKIFAAASHSVLGNISNNINNLRLDTTHPYFNSGVILIDLDEARQIVDVDIMIEKVNQSTHIDLILPDQDLFNSLYGEFVHEIPDELYNYDARFYGLYLLNSGNKYDLDWVLANTKILHFCGKQKPWNTKNPMVFNSLYKYFMYL